MSVRRPPEGAGDATAVVGQILSRRRCAANQLVIGGRAVGASRSSVCPTIGLSRCRRVLAKPSRMTVAEPVHASQDGKRGQSSRLYRGMRLEEMSQRSFGALLAHDGMCRGGGCGRSSTVIIQNPLPICGLRLPGSAPITPRRLSGSATGSRCSFAAAAQDGVSRWRSVRCK